MDLADLARLHTQMDCSIQRKWCSSGSVPPAEAQSENCFGVTFQYQSALTIIPIFDVYHFSLVPSNCQIECFCIGCNVCLCFWVVTCIVLFKQPYTVQESLRLLSKIISTAPHHTSPEALTQVVSINSVKIV